MCWLSGHSLTCTVPKCPHTFPSPASLSLLVTSCPLSSPRRGSPEVQWFLLMSGDLLLQKTWKDLGLNRTKLVNAVLGVSAREGEGVELLLCS